MLTNVFSDENSTVGIHSNSMSSNMMMNTPLKASSKTPLKSSHTPFGSRHTPLQQKQFAAFTPGQIGKTPKSANRPALGDISNRKKNSTPGPLGSSRKPSANPSKKVGFSISSDSNSNSNNNSTPAPKKVKFAVTKTKSNTPFKIQPTSFGSTPCSTPISKFGAPSVSFVALAPQTSLLDEIDIDIDDELGCITVPTITTNTTAPNNTPCKPSDTVDDVELPAGRMYTPSRNHGVNLSIDLDDVVRLSQNALLSSHESGFGNADTMENLQNEMDELGVNDLRDGCQFERVVDFHCLGEEENEKDVVEALCEFEL